MNVRPGQLCSIAKMEFLGVIESRKCRIKFITFDSIDIVIVLNAACVFFSTGYFRQFSLRVFTGELMTSKDIAVVERLQTRRETDARITHDLPSASKRDLFSSVCVCKCLLFTVCC